MDPVTEAPALAHLAQRAEPFPFAQLENCETGLCLFAAGFYGVNDAIHFAMSGVDTTCVDLDGEKIDAMRAIYPPEWTFVQADAWTFAEAARELELSWDAVCVDPFTGDAMTRSMESLDLWLSLADRVLIAGTDVFPFAAPAEWNVTVKYVRRPPVAYWLILERGS